MENLPDAGMTESQWAPVESNGRTARTTNLDGDERWIFNDLMFHLVSLRYPISFSFISLIVFPLGQTTQPINIVITRSC